jgi:hypothetical protein
MTKFLNLFVVLLVSINSAIAQPLDFPSGARTPLAAELNTVLKNKVFSVATAQGASWRLEYVDNGYFYLNTSSGQNLSGKWSVSDGKLCSQIQGRNAYCGDARVFENVLYFKRDSGEIIKYLPR